MEYLGRNNIMANQIQNKPTAAYWLSMIGGILGFIVSIILFILGGLAYAALGTLGDYSGYYGYDYGASAAYGLLTLYFGLAIWCIITSVLVIIFARKLMANPMQHKKWGILILVFSIIGVGSLLGFIGGILAIVYNPMPAGAPQQYYAPPPQQAYQAPPPQQAHPCPQCGTMVQPGVRFCPNCGRQQY
jgi:hypothetical protein